MKRSLWFLCLGLTVALAALLLATPVHAQDLAPEPGAAPVSDPAAAESPTGEALAEPAPEAPVEPAPAPEGEAPALAEEAALAAESAPPAGETPPAAAEETAPVETLAEAGVTLADESGAALPLASGGDPYFTVGATTYRFYQAVGACAGAPNCWDGLAKPITEAVTKVGTGLIPNDRKIYVEAATYTETVTIDGSAFAPLAQLMGLEGGVDASGVPNRIITGKLEVKNVNLGFTLNGFWVQGGIDIGPVSGAVTLKDVLVNGVMLPAGAIYVHDTSGAVNVERVQSTQNNADGLVINNPNGFGAVTITNSRFDWNDDPANIIDYTGLKVLTKGAITVNGVSASMNTGMGTKLVSTASLVSVRNSAMLNNLTNAGDPLFGYGLWVESLFGTTVDNVVASENERSGIRATSSNAVTLSNIIAGFNGLDGISVAKPANEALPDDDWTLSGGTVVTMTNIDVDANNRHGLLVRSSSAITINTIDAFNNGSIAGTSDHGANLDNCLYDGSNCTGIGNIVVTNGNFNGHPNPGNRAQDTGLYAASRGSVLLSGVSTYNNLGDGVFIDTWWTNSYGFVNISGTPDQFAGFGENGDDGLEVWSKQAITLSYVDASGNGGRGASLNNNASGSAAPVTLSDTNFSKNQDFGLQVISHGAITLTRTYADSNGLVGGSGDGANLDNSGAAYPMPVSLTFSAFWQNHDAGLWVQSKGFISLYGVDAGDNGSHGAYLINALTGAYSGVNALGASTNALYPLYSSFNDNNATGLTVYSNGPVLVTNTNFYNNDHEGLFLDNSGSNFGAITLTNIYTDQNGYTGAWLATRGTVSWTNGRANNNGWQGGLYDGITVSNQSGPYAMPVILTNIETQGNINNGLTVQSKGAITIGNVQAQNNQAGGAGLYNATGTYSMVYIYLSRFNWNAGAGLEVISNGFIQLSQVEAQGSGTRYGMKLDNSASPYLLGVTYSIGGTSNNQGGSGLEIDTRGFITLVDVSSNDNNGYGADLNSSAGTAGGVTFIGGYWGNSFNRNNGVGFQAMASGPITLYNLDASENAGNGLFLNNEAGYSGPVTIYGTLPYWTNGYNNNGSTGLMVNSWSVITLYNVAASGNLLEGAHLDNSGALYPMGVSVTRGSFNENQNGDGLAVYSKGAVTINYVDAERNSADWNGVAHLGYTVQDHLANWDGDGDHWWFTLTGPTSLVVAMDVVSGNIDPYLEIFNEDGGSTGWSDDNGAGVGGNALIDMGASTLGAGRYYIEARQVPNFSDGEYLLAINDPGKTVDYAQARNLYVDNSGWNGSTYTGVGAISINGLYNDWNYFNHSAGNGIELVTNGGVMMTYVQSDTNSSLGIDITDFSPAASIWANIHVYSNPGSGIAMWTRGSYFSLYGGEINNNGGLGLDLSSTASSVANFTALTNVMANDNQDDGLSLYTTGPVSMVNIEARHNKDLGLDINNLAGSGAGYVYILGAGNYFTSNTDNNLQINTRGSVLLQNVEANSSKTNNGAVIDNSTGTGTVTIQGLYAYPNWYSTFSDNAGTGLAITSRGFISLYKVQTNGNAGMGADITNSTSTTFAPISISSSQFNGNQGGNGASVYSAGAITLTTVRADGNSGGRGMYVTNQGSTSPYPQGITVSNSWFVNNNTDGLYALSKGNILGYTVRALYNGNYGVVLDNYAAGATGTISLYGSYGENTFTGNSNGLYAESSKAVTLYNLAATLNVNEGVNVFTDAGITVSQGRFNSNGSHGLSIDAKQLITLSYLTAISNGDALFDADGIHLATHGANATLGYSTVTGNMGNGVDALLGGGSLTLTAVNTFGNDRDMDEATGDVYRH